MRCYISSIFFKFSSYKDIIFQNFKIIRLFINKSLGISGNSMRSRGNCDIGGVGSNGDGGSNNSVSVNSECCHSDTHSIVSTGTTVQQAQHNQQQPSTPVTQVTFYDDESSCDSHSRWGKRRNENKIN